MKTLTTTSPADSRLPARRTRVTPLRVAGAVGVTAVGLLAAHAGGPSEAQKKETKLLNEIKDGKGNHQFDDVAIVVQPGVKIHDQPSLDLGGEDGNSQNVSSEITQKGYIEKPLITHDEKGGTWYGFSRKQGDSLEDKVVWVSGAPKDEGQTNVSGEPYVYESTAPNHVDSASTAAHYDAAKGLVDQQGQRIAQMLPADNTGE